MNLLDYSEDTTADDLYTAVIPHGVRLDESPVEGLEAYLDITSVNDGKNYLYIRRRWSGMGGSWLYGNGMM